MCQCLCVGVRLNCSRRVIGRFTCLLAACVDISLRFGGFPSQVAPICDCGDAETAIACAARRPLTLRSTSRNCQT